MKCHGKRVTFARIHLYIDLQSSYDGYDGSYGIHQIDYIEHHCYRKVMSIAQCVCSPAIIDTSAFG